MNNKNNCQTTRSQTVKPAHERRSEIEKLFPIWKPQTIAQHLDAMTEKYAHKDLVITNEKSYSYAEIKAWSIKIAAGLLHSGMGPGDHIAVIMANYPEFIALKFAIARIGAVAIPINYSLREQELKYILKQSDARMLITMSSFGGQDYQVILDSIFPDWERKNTLKGNSNLENIVIFSTEDDKRDDAFTFQQLEESGNETNLKYLQAIALMDLAETNSDIVYTSGTTGSPKGVLLNHDMVLRAAYASAYTSGFQGDWKILFSLPMYHVFGYVECLIATTFVGGAVIPQVSFDPELMVAAAEEHKASEIVCVPLMTQKIIELVKKRGFDGSNLTIMFNSGGVCPASIWTDIRKYLNADEVITAYGMSETTASTACTFPEGDDNYLLTTNGKLKFAGVAGDESLNGILAVYKTIDTVTGEDLDWGESGELLVKGPAVTKGYYNKPEETKAAFTDDGWFRSGDIGTISKEGYLKLTGRVKESYRCGSEMVMPVEIENLLNSSSQIKQSIVVGIPDQKMGEVGCACIIKNGIDEPNIEELKELCIEKLAKFKVPKYFIILEESDIPMTATGRPQKFKLADKIIKQFINKK